MHEENLVLTPEDCALIIKALSEDPMETLTGGARDRYDELVYSLKESAKLVLAPLNGDKVWGGLPSYSRSVIYNGKTHNQVRTIVRARNKAEAMRFLGAAGVDCSPTNFNNYWSVTGNRRELSLVTERGVWAEGNDGWVRLYPKDPK